MSSTTQQRSPEVNMPPLSLREGIDAAVKALVNGADRAIIRVTLPEDRMLTWTKTSNGLTAQHGERMVSIRKWYAPTWYGPGHKGKLWSGQLWRVAQTRNGTLQEPGATFGHGDELTLLKRRAEAILLQTPSRWYRIKLGGYCFSADGTLYSCHWHQGAGRFHAGAGIKSCPDDSFATLAEARAYLMKASGGAA